MHLARPVLPYDLDPGAMLNICKMCKKYKAAKTSEGSEMYRCYDVLFKIILVIFVIIWYIVPAEGCRDTVDGCPLRREVIQCT